MEKEMQLFDDDRIAFKLEGWRKRHVGL